MVTISVAIASRFPEADPLRDYVVFAHAQGQRIAYWNTATLGPRPTAEDLAEWALLIKPPPNWLGFAAALNAHPTTLGLAGMAQQNPAVLLLLNNLSVGLGQAAQGNPATFQAAWAYGVAAGAINTEMIAIVSALGAQFNLPGEFLEALEP